MSTQLLTVVEASAPDAAANYPWYGIRNAVQDAAGTNSGSFIYYYGASSTESHVVNNTVILWSDGCITDTGPNCTAACMDAINGPPLVWNAANPMLTLHNCLVYPIIAVAAANDWLDTQSKSLLEKYHITPNSTLLGETTSNMSVASGWPVINGCLDTVAAADQNSDIIPSAIYTTIKLGPLNATWSPTLVCDVHTVR